MEQEQKQPMSEEKRKIYQIQAEIDKMSRSQRREYKFKIENALAQLVSKQKPLIKSLNAFQLSMGEVELAMEGKHAKSEVNKIATRLLAIRNDISTLVQQKSALLAKRDANIFKPPLVDESLHNRTVSGTG